MTRLARDYIVLSKQVDKVPSLQGHEYAYLGLQWQKITSAVADGAVVKFMPGSFAVHPSAPVTYIVRDRK